MRLALTLTSLFASCAVHAECTNDFSTTLEANSKRQDFLACRNVASGRSCRELNNYPHDFRNAMRNYMVQGGGLDEVRNLSWFEKQAQYSKTFCNDHGQCASVIMTTYFETFDVTLSAGVVSTRLTLRDALDEGAVREFDLTVQMPDDTPYHTDGYSPAFLDAAAPLANIPADSRADTARSGECLDNNGDEVKNKGNNSPTTGRFGGWYGAPIPYYGRPRIPSTPPPPSRICGTSRISDGPSRTTCRIQ